MKKIREWIRAFVVANGIFVSAFIIYAFLMYWVN